MTKREAPKQITKKNARLISLGMLALSLAIAFVCVKGMLTPIRYDVKVGEASPATILATCEAVDEINTEIMREKARMETGSIYAIDSVKIGEYKCGAEDFFSGIDKLYGKAAANIPEDADIPASAAQWGERGNITRHRRSKPSRRAFIYGRSAANTQGHHNVQA